MSFSSGSSIGAKLFVPKLARSTEEQRELNENLVRAALANDPILVHDYLLQGADPSSTMEISFQLLPMPAVAPEGETMPTPAFRAPNFTVPLGAKFSTDAAQTVTLISALHAAVINCCWGDM